MSFQHRNLAAVWGHLAGLDNISTTLREITGQHVLQDMLQDDLKRSREESTRTVIWIKTIFDLQRCYLSGTTTGISECPPEVASCLLPPELLLSSILYLIDLRLKRIITPGELTAEGSIHANLILTQTVLSGLRIILFRKQNLSEYHRQHLQSAIQAAWEDDDIQGTERLIARQVFPAILNSLHDLKAKDHYRKERESARLPNYAKGLYPLDTKPELFVTPLIHAMAEEDEDWIDAYLVLYDALWAVECAITQRYVDLRRQHGESSFKQVGPDTDEILEQLCHKRTSLILSIFHITGPMIPSSLSMESLAVSLLDWDEDLDSFLSRQDSLLQHRTSLRPSPARTPNYGKHVAALQPYFDSATSSFNDWLSQQNLAGVSITVVKAHDMANSTRDIIKEWVGRIASPSAKILSQGMEEPCVPLYIVDCPKLHAIPQKWLANQLRWCDKFAYESIQENPPILDWKEGFQCPSCTSEGKVKCARLIEPLQQPFATPNSLSQGDYGSSQESNESSGSYVATSSSGGSHLLSDSGTGNVSLQSQPTMTVTIPTSISHSSSDLDRSKSAEEQPPQYSDSPISPFTHISPYHHTRSFGTGMSEYPISPLNESLNIPIPRNIGSRSSVDLPIPINTPSVRNSISEKISVPIPPDLDAPKPETPPRALTWNENSAPKSKPASRTVRIANSMRRKPSAKVAEAYALPKEPVLAFSSLGQSLLLWGKHGDYVARFDFPSSDTSTIQCARYDVKAVEAAAAGHRKCAILAASNVSKKRLLVFVGLNTNPETDIELDFSGRITDFCISISKDDKHLALSMNGQIELFSLDNGLKRVAFHQQMDVFELRGGVSHRRSIPITRMTSDESVTAEIKSESGSWFTEQSKCLSSKEVAEEQQRQTVIISRKLYFSTDSERLVVATQLADHCVYIDVWDVTREPVSTIAEHSRSFKLPPWTLNDGDLTGVFYDSNRRAALVTAFLGKEYPILVPFPGYEALQNETYSTKIISATQSPSGATFIVANGMTEIIQFQYTTKGTFSPHKLKKSSSKISTSVFKPGSIALAMPTEDCLRAFWIKDGKCMLRSIKLGTSETIKDVDIRTHFDRLMSLKDRPVIAQAPRMDIPELDAGDFI